MKTKKREIVFVASKQVVLNNSKINWPDQNFPGSGHTILRIVYNIDYDNLQVQLDGEEGIIINNKDLPEGVGFYERI